MIGLLFFGAIALWGVIAIALGIKLPKWLGIQRYCPLWTVLLVPLVFFAPVADEIIAYPQMKALCKSVEVYRYDKAMATNRTISKYAYVLNRHTRKLFPTLHVTETVYGLRAIDNGEAIVQWTTIESSGGALRFPAGSSGTTMPLILPSECSTEPRGSSGLDSLKSELQLRLSDLDLSNIQ